VLVGGVLTSAAGWRWIFFINVPVGVLVLAHLPVLVASSPPRASRARVDVPGALAVTAATGAAIYGLISAGSHGWLTARTLVPVAADVLYAVFAAIEHTVAAPPMDLRMLARRPVAAGAFLMPVGTGLLVSAFFLGSFYLQQHQGYSALHTGLLAGIIMSRAVRHGASDHVSGARRGGARQAMMAAGRPHAGRDYAWRGARCIILCSGDIAVPNTPAAGRCARVCALVTSDGIGGTDGFGGTVP
jgi:Major Facilitator Superfamily